MRIQCASIPFTLVFEIRGQCASYVLMVTQLLRVAKWPTLTLAVLAVLLLFNYDRLRLKHERDRRILRSTRPTRWVEFAPAVPRLTLRNLWDNCPRDQLAKPDRRPMRIETTSGGGFANAHWDAHRNQCASGVNTRMRIQCAFNAHYSSSVNTPLWANQMFCHVPVFIHLKISSHASLMSAFSHCCHEFWDIADLHDIN